MAVLYLRDVDEGTVREAKMAAAARGLTLAQYFDHLVDLHSRGMARAPYERPIAELLEEVKLQTVVR